MSKSKRLYFIDITIAIAAILSILSGLVLLLSASGGSLGGSSASLKPAVWGLGRETWRDLHIWVSLVMVAGALIHILLHWPWLVRMTKRLLGFGPLGNTPIRSFKAKLFYAIDTVMGFSLTLVTLTGLVLFLLGSGGYQGGRNPNFQTALLGLGRGNWNDLHALFGLVIAGAALAHVSLHWHWVVSMTRRLARPKGNPNRQVPVIVTSK